MRDAALLPPELEALFQQDRLGEVLMHGLVPLPPLVFEEVAEFLLEGAEMFLDAGRADLAQAIAQAVSRSAKAWGQRQGRIAGYAEAQVERGRRAERFLGREGARMPREVRPPPESE